jgi:hypothetical protein
MIKTYLPAGAAGASAGAAGAAGASAGAAGAAGASAGFGASCAFLQPATVRANATISTNERIKAITFFTWVTSSSL